MSFSIKNNLNLSNLSGRFVLAPNNPRYKPLVKNNGFIVKKDITTKSISTNSLKLVGVNEGASSNISSYGLNKWTNFGISREKIVHDIIMPPLILTFNEQELNSAFGVSVAISGNTFIAGAPEHGDGRGAAYIYRKNINGTWELTTTLFGQNDGDKFGTSVSISGNKVIIGAPYADNAYGRAYIYTLVDGDWIFNIMLIGNLPSIERFGASVSISGDKAIVGAPDRDNGRGRVYFYSFNNNIWASVSIQGTNNGDHFGESVSISYDKAIVGAPDRNGGRGSVYFYKYDGNDWIVDGSFDGENGGDLFGTSVYVSEDSAIVGASNYDSKGAAYIYKYNANWSQDGAILIGDKTGDYFGNAVSIEEGDTVIIGASFGGYIHTYVKIDNDWILDITHYGKQDTVSISVAISDDFAVVGDRTYPDIGTVYLLKSGAYKGDIKVRTIIV